mgnify:CR=1 FL=1
MKKANITYIHTLLLPPQWGFSGTIFKLPKLLITIQLKLIKFKKHLQHCLKFVINYNTKDK